VNADPRPVKLSLPTIVSSGGGSTPSRARPGNELVVDHRVAAVSKA
jgi:hypothetical protein